MTIPSPAQAVWHLGPVPLRAYAFCILVGIVLAVRITSRRWRVRGGRDGGVLDVAAYAVPFGIVGARLYHVATSWQPYFGEAGHPLDALKVWEGGLGIWGAVAGGALGAYVACRRLDLPFVVFADSVAPGLAVGQAVGRIGNWFNNELYGGRTDLPWGLQIHPWDSAAGQAVRTADGAPQLLPGAYHPTFLYEALWCLLVAAAVVLLDRRYRMDHGRSLALYVMLYTAGRFYIESLRIDEANIILGHRLNEWTSVLVFGSAAVGYLRTSRRNGWRGRSTSQDADGVPERQDI
jgi:prolipoprotein diacylglyceryl transferase